MAVPVPDARVPLLALGAAVLACAGHALEPRTAVVDLGALVAGYPRTKALEAVVNAELDRVRHALEADQDGLRVMRTGRDRGPTLVFGSSEYDAARTAMRRQQAAFEAKQECLQQSLRRRVEELDRLLLAELQVAIDKHARAEGIDLVLLGPSRPVPGGYLGQNLPPSQVNADSRTIDVTDDVARWAARPEFLARMARADR